MILIILGIILFAAAGFMNKEREEFIKLAKGVRIAGIAIALVGVLTSCIKQIDAGKLVFKAYLVKSLIIFYTAV